MVSRERIWFQTALAVVPLVSVLLLAAGIHWVKLYRQETAQARALAHVRGLERSFRAAGYRWPPAGPVPARFVARLPLGLAQLQAAERKALFFRLLLPVVLAENARIREQRRALLGLFAAPAPTPAALAGGRALAAQYGVEGKLDDPAVRARLLRRVDVVPAGLVLAQAANESAWGTSRFAREGNNLFGQWTWRAEVGLVPRRREAGATHYVRAFTDIRASVRAYLHNINVAAAYRPLRRLRAALRREHRPLEPTLLAAGLVRYSERGQAYVEDVRTMIRANGLDRLGALSLEG